MENKALYLLAQFDDETQEILSGYYTILQKNGFVGEQTKNIPYHFTLGSKNVDYENQMLYELEEISSETKCIDICLGHIGLFGLNVLFIEPNVNFELLNLQKSFFGDCGNGCHSWAAHATILIDQPEMVLKALPIIAESFKPFCARIESIALYEFFPTRFIKKCELR